MGFQRRLAVVILLFPVRALWGLSYRHLYRAQPVRVLLVFALTGACHALYVRSSVFSTEEGEMRVEMIDRTQMIPARVHWLSQ